MQSIMHDHSLENTEATLDFGRALAGHLKQGDIIALNGPLAAGKTTLTRGLLQGLGLPDTADVPSPSFTLMQHYEAPPLRIQLWHADLYRLENEAEVLGLGLEDIYDDAITVIEWPERMGRLLPATALEFSLKILPDGRRMLAYPHDLHRRMMGSISR